MNGKTLLGVAAAAAVAGLAGCAAPGGYGGGYNGGYGGGYNAPPPQAGYQQPGYQQGYPQPGYQQPGPATYQAPAGSVFYGRVESIEPVTTQQGGSSGLLGTVIGGLAGGLLGHQIGGGTGNTVATIGGAVLGGVAGNQVERRVDGPETVYRVNVRLDDGRLATVTQRNVGNLRVGARAQVANDMATPY
ncbi:glycine zipper 2TM domain-containing protein [Cupriavidus sp. 30B13]|uniref:glycine zipper 2TM domain-containing protein n=1 Tax=Cupriavidus sp. 30B13 TaxID=3384241 RepID=UPI003B900C52